MDKLVTTIEKKIIFEHYIMACVSDYTFNKTSRISNDQCDRSQQNIQNADVNIFD